MLNNLKKMFSGHKSSFNLERYQHRTVMSQVAWRIKENDGVPNVAWRIIRKEKAYTPKTRRCMHPAITGRIKNVFKTSFVHVMDFSKPSQKRPVLIGLCLAEIFEITMYSNDSILNKRSEIIAKCRHRRKHLLTSFDNMT